MKENEPGPAGAPVDKVVNRLTGKMSLPQMIDVIKRCGEATGTTITEEGMAGELGLSWKQWVGYAAGDEGVQDRLTSLLNQAYKGLFAAVRLDGHRKSLESMIRAVRSISKELGKTVSVEAIAARVDLSVEELQAYANGDVPVPPDLSTRLHAAYGDLFKALEQHNRTMPLRSTISVIELLGEKKGLVITKDEMAQRVGIARAEFDAFLEEADREPGELDERLRTAYQELLQHTRTVRSTSQEKLRRPLLFDLPDE